LYYKKRKGREDYIEKTLSSGHVFAPSVLRNKRRKEKGESKKTKDKSHKTKIKTKDKSKKTKGNLIWISGRACENFCVN
jgi:hypothetical protein